MTQAPGFFERALASDPGNIEALVGAASVDYMRATSFFADDRAALLAAAEATLTKALSLAPEHALAHLWLGRRPNPNQPRGPRHCRMRAGVGTRSKFGRCSRNIGVAQAFYRSRRGNRGSHQRGAPPQSSRYERLLCGWQFAGLAKLALGSDEEAVALVASRHRDQPKLSDGALLPCRRACASRST